MLHQYKPCHGAKAIYLTSGQFISILKTRPSGRLILPRNDELAVVSEDFDDPHLKGFSGYVVSHQMWSLTANFTKSKTKKAGFLLTQSWLGDYIMPRVLSLSRPFKIDFQLVIARRKALCGLKPGCWEEAEPPIIHLITAD